MKIFHYENETYGIDLIARNFITVFKRAYTAEQRLFLESYQYTNDELINNINKLYDLKSKTTKPLKHISQHYLNGSKSFDEYYIANMYYKLSFESHSKLSKYSSSIILKFHIAYLNHTKQDADADLSTVFRFFVHIIEVIECLNKYNIKNIYNKHSTHLDNVLESINQNIIKVIKHDKYDFGIEVDDILYGINSNIVVKNLNLINNIHSFKLFYEKSRKNKIKKPTNRIDTTEQNKKYAEDQYFVTKARKDLEPLSLEDKIEEDNALKEHIEVKIENRKNSKTTQSKKILAVSSAISKNKLQLPSLYSVPSIGFLSSFCKFIIARNENDEETSFYVGIFIISIVTGIHPEDIIRIFFARKKYESDNNTIELKLDGNYFAKYDRFTKRVGVETVKKIRYKIPFELLHYINKLRNKNIVYDADKFKKELSILQKKSKTIMHINFKKIWNCSSIHKKLVSKNINTEMLLATQNIDQNTTPILAYTATPVDMGEYSQWLNEYIEILGIKSDLQNHLFGKVLSNEIIINTEKKRELIGSKKIVKQDELINFLKNIENLLKERRLDKYARFNIYSMHVRYTLSMLLGTRDFSISVDLNRISWKKNIIIIKEKGKYKNSGYRAVPLCSVAQKIIKNYLLALESFNIKDKAVILFYKRKQVPAILSNIKIVFKDFVFYKKYFNLYEMIDLIPLNVGRHILTTMATAAGVDRDDMNAFMGHAVNGGESLGIYSFHNVKEYRNTFTMILEEISELYELKDIHTNVRL